MDKTTRAVAALHEGARKLAGNFMIPAEVSRVVTEVAGLLEAQALALAELRKELQELRELSRTGCEGCGGEG